MSASHGELLGWVLSLSFLTAVLAVLLFHIRQRPSAFDSIPWREIVAVAVALSILFLLAFLFPFAGRVFLPDSGNPSLLNR
jgi:hypothetical protein